MRTIGGWILIPITTTKCLPKNQALETFKIDLLHLADKLKANEGLLAIFCCHGHTYYTKDDWELVLTVAKGPVTLISTSCCSGLWEDCQGRYSLLAASSPKDESMGFPYSRSGRLRGGPVAYSLLNVPSSEWDFDPPMPLNQEPTLQDALFGDNRNPTEGKPVLLNLLPESSLKLEPQRICLKTFHSMESQIFADMRRLSSMHPYPTLHTSMQGTQTLSNQTAV